jgi:3-dehydroquinate synthetase
MTAATATTLTREIVIGPHCYPIYARAGGWEELATHASTLKADRFALVSDPGVPGHLLHAAEECLSGLNVPVTRYTVPPGEKVKTWGTVGEVMDAITGAGATRSSVVVAVGGGYAENIAGLASAIIFRGDIRLVHLPTTLLAMSDSVLSLKQAVNGPHGKNHYGSFKAPEFVWCELEFLADLPADQIRCALCELIKNVVGILPDRYGWVLAALRPDANYSLEQITAFIDLCVTAKTQVMGNDPHERGEGLILELGHTVGHAIELLTHGDIPHGYAIGLGLLAAAQVAVDAGYLDAADAEAHRVLLTANGAPTTLPAGVLTSDLGRLLKTDNKRGLRNQPPPRPGMAEMVLLEALGRPRRNAMGGLITQVPFAAVAAAIDKSLRPGGPR